MPAVTPTPPLGISRRVSGEAPIDAAVEGGNNGSIGSASRPRRLDAKLRRVLGYWGITLSVYLLCIGLLWYEAAHGAAGVIQAAWLTVYALGGQLAFLFMILASKRANLKHAQIATMQGFHAIVAIVAAYASVSAVRGATLLLLLVVLVFCSFTLPPRRSRIMSGFAITLLGLTMLWLIRHDPAHHRASDETIHFVLAASMLLAVTLMTSQFDYLRRRLQAEKNELGEALSRIKLLATRDDLTRLPNRRHMHEVLSAEERRFAAGGRHFCLILLDLDFFKNINDRHGHEVGDKVLVAFAARLQGYLRATDVLARWGGEEFLLLLPGADEASAAATLQRMQQQIVEIALPGLEQILYVTFSAGLAVVVPGEPINDAINRADKAMFQAKAAGRNTFRIFDPDVDEQARGRDLMKQELRHGINAGQLVLHFQPQIDAAGTVIAAEALVRWLHPTRGLIPPADFIPLAEAMGLIQDLGEWVMRAACEQLKQWDAVESTRQLCVSVNVSARQLHSASFVHQVMSVIGSTGIDPRRLKLELTESMLIEDMDATILKMKTLQSHGISFSLDDFGTGYSSLSYLKRLPLDELKIDQSFVRDMLVDTNDAVIVTTIISLARSLGLSVIAEGVETPVQRDAISDQGCDGFQGYLFSRPLPIHEFDRFIDSYTRMPMRSIIEPVKAGNAG